MAQRFFLQHQGYAFKCTFQVRSEVHPMDTAYAEAEQGYEIFTSDSDLHGENKSLLKAKA